MPDKPASAPTLGRHERIDAREKALAVSGYSRNDRHMPRSPMRSTLRKIHPMRPEPLD
jgi:hypothetical protein